MEQTFILISLNLTIVLVLLLVLIFRVLTKYKNDKIIVGLILVLGLFSASLFMLHYNLSSHFGVDDEWRMYIKKTGSEKYGF